MLCLHGEPGERSWSGDPLLAADQEANGGTRAKIVPTSTDTLASSVHGTRIRRPRRSVNAPQTYGFCKDGCDASDFGVERQFGDDVTGGTELWNTFVQTYSGLWPPQM